MLVSSLSLSLESTVCASLQSWQLSSGYSQLNNATDFTQRWIVNDNWTYTADLTPLTADLTNDTTALLVFYGIDTVANIVSKSAITG